jgi:solute carrier family 35 protein C2
MRLPLARTLSGGYAPPPAPAPVATLPYSAVLYILGWYAFLLSISIYNKWMFGPTLDFHFPVLITAFHQACLFALSLAVLYYRPHYRPQLPLAVALPLLLPLSLSLPLGLPLALALPPRLPPPPPRLRLHHLTRIVPCAVASAADIGLSNVSFRYISLSLYTMLKTLSLGFVLVFGVLLGLEKFRWSLVAIIVTMMASVLLMVAPDSAAAVGPAASTGTLLVLGALLMSGLRWLCTQVLLKHSPLTPNPIATIFFLSPAMLALLLVTGLAVEGALAFLAAPVWHMYGVAQTVVLMVVPGVLAFMMTLCEFKLLAVAPVITLLVAGIFKELLTIVASLAIYGDTLTRTNCLGLVLTFADILWYNWFRYAQRDHPARLHSVPLAPLALGAELKKL